MGILDPKPQTQAGLDAAITAKINDGASAARGALNATYLDKVSADKIRGGVPAWAPDTAYVAGAPVIAPDGSQVNALVAFTSGSTFNAANWSANKGYVTLAGTKPGTIPVLRTVADTRSGNWEYIHNGGTGYLWHLMAGAESLSGAWMFGIGLDGGFGNGIIVRNKSKGIGIKIEMLDTISSATAYGLAVEQKSTVAPAVSMTQNAGATAPLHESFSFVNDGTDTAVMQRWGAYAKPAGEIRSTSGKLVWSQNIEVIGEALDVRDYNVVPVGDRYRTKVIPRGITLHSLSATNSWYGFRISGSGSYFTLNVAAPSANPDAATYTQLVALRSLNGGEVSFHGVTPVARQAVLAAATDPATTMALVNDLRAKLIAKGLVS